MSVTEVVVRCVIYLRVSLDATGEQLAIARQREDCLKIAAARGWEVIAEFVDNSIGAYSKTRVRPGYDAMVQAYEAGRFDALVCWDLDRLTRQPRQLEDWIDRAEDRGLLLVTANGEADLTNDNGKLFARIKAGVARAESERKAARQARALQQRAESGRPPLGVRLTGYTTAGEVIEEEAEFVRAVFRRFYEGDSLRGITAWLTGLGAATRHGAPWNPSTIRGTLTNPRYAGRAIYRGKPTGELGNWEPLVEDWVFDEVNERLADPGRKTQKGTHRKHLGSGLYLCGYPVGAGTCDAPVRSHTAVPTGQPSQVRYRCPRGGHVTRSSVPVDEHVILLVCAAAAEEDARADLEPETDELRLASEEVKRLRGLLRKTDRDYDEDLIDGVRHKAKTARITAELDEAEAARSRLTAGPHFASLLAEWGPDPAAIRAGFKSLPLGSQRALIGGQMTVRLAPAPRGKHFDPASVLIDWRHG